MSDKRLFLVRPDNAEEVARVARFIERSKVKLRVIVEPYRAKRSLAQNALAHVWVSLLRTHVRETTGQAWSQDDMWEAVKRKTLSPKVVPDLDTGEPMLVYDTHSLTVPEFSDWLHAVEHYCAERWELQLPHPEDLYAEAQDE